MKTFILVSVCVLLFQNVAPIGAADTMGSGRQQSDLPQALLRKSEGKVLIRKDGESITVSSNKSTLEEILQRIAEERKVILNFYCDDPSFKQERAANLMISADSLVETLRRMLAEGSRFTLLNQEGKPAGDKRDVAAVNVYPKGCTRIEQPVRLFIPEREHPVLRKPPSEISLDELGAVFRREGPASRRRAMDILGIKADERGIAYAKEALKDENPEVMLAAANALRRLGQKYGSEKVADALYERFREKPYAELLPIMAEVDKEKVWPIIDSLMDQSGATEQGIITRVLVATNDRRAIKYLSKVASTGSVENSAQAIYGMGKIGGPEAAAALTRLLRDRDAQRQAMAARAVYLLPGDDAPSARAEVDRILMEGRASEALIQALVNGLILEPIQKLMKDPASTVETKMRALKAMANLGSEKYIDIMAEGLNDKNSQVRIASVETLGVVADEAAVPHLIRAAGDDDANVRSRAVRALSDFPGDDGVVQALGKALYDADESVRRQAVDAFVLLGRPSEAETKILKECKNHKDAYVANKARSILKYWNLEKTVE